MSSSIHDKTLSGIVLYPRRQRDVRPFCLEQIDGSGAPRKVTLEQEVVTLGRGEEALLRLATPLASRHHATLRLVGTEYRLEDNDSRNGVFLNGLKVHTALLRDGDIIQVADCVFTFHEG